MAYQTPYYKPARQRRQAWRASANDPSMPEHWGEFVNGGGDSFLQDIDPTAALTGAASLGANYLNMSNESLNLSEPRAMQRSATGEPIYGAGVAFNEAFLSKPQGATGGEVLSGVGQGAAAGAAFGPIGAGVGAVVGGLGSLLGGGRRKRKQREERDKALKKVSASQQSFNKASEQFSEQQTALSDYRQRLNIQDQLYNLYR